VLHIVCRLPRPQHGHAHAAFQIDVRMIDLVDARDLGPAERVLLGELKLKLKDALLPKPAVNRDYECVVVIVANARLQGKRTYKHEESAMSNTRERSGSHKKRAARREAIQYVFLSSTLDGTSRSAKSF
jgi:hypothetical protein